MSSKSVQELVPGDPRQIWLLANSYNRMANICEDVGQAFRGIDDGGWSGMAAEAFRARFERQPNRVLAMADNYDKVAVALDTYASALAWAQRQAREVIALDAEEAVPSGPARPALTPSQQAERTGVITGEGGSEPVRVPEDPRTVARETYRRALDILDAVGNESAAVIRTAAKQVPAPSPADNVPTVLPTPSAPTVPSTSVANLELRAVFSVPAPRRLPEPTALQDDPRDWSAAIREVRKRLRWDGLNRQSPRLAQHVFEGHYNPGRRSYSGYHHREGGIDHGVLRVAEIIEGPDAHGVYTAHVAGPRTPPATMKKSTFFPDSWSRAEVLYAVRRVFLDAMQSRAKNYDPVRRRFRGVYRGVRIEGYLKAGAADPRLCDIVTAYPRGVERRRKPS